MEFLLKKGCGSPASSFIKKRLSHGWLLGILFFQFSSYPERQLRKPWCSIKVVLNFEEKFPVRDHLFGAYVKLSEYEVFTR